MILNEICSVVDFQFIVFLSTHESFFPTTIRQWSWTSGGVFPLKLRQSGLCYLNIEYLRLHHRRIHDYDVNFFKLRKNFQTQIWDPGVHIYRFANGGIRRLRTDQIKGSRFMFVLTIEILVLHLAKTSTSFSIDGDIFLLSPIVSFGLRETLLGFKTRINRRLDEPVSLPQSSQEELNLVIQRGLWLFVDWMITIHRWPPNIQDEVLKLIPIWIKEWRIHDEYLREHIIGVIEKANQAIEDYSFISYFDQHVIEVHDLVAEKLHHIKATYSKGHFIESAIIVVLWYREFFGINKRKIQEKEILPSPRFAIEHGIYLCPVLDLLSNIYWLQWKHSLWQQPWERKQWIYPDEHRSANGILEFQL
ncbi:hypothetical protein ISN44_As10g018230 [Arabidopsis suecica]|uniref:Uncharacterized protein n=1 Tax=Arabidopsis suecica TaxID=45249 RepID=A0A8T1ZWK7_ARASU|nr:hypothetical protein ISN44_As10g018230 [Arabidopsis suecica]